jgi:hypothetical protein
MSYDSTEPPILTATYTEGYRIEFIFADGVCGILDFSEILKESNGIFKKLKDIRFFSRVRFNPETRTVEWPNSADFSPNYLHEQTLLQNPNAPKLNTTNMDKYQQYIFAQRKLRVPPPDEVSFFSDISITMPHADGLSPYFRAAYTSYYSPASVRLYQATFEIETGKVIVGNFHSDAQDFVEEWRQQHLAELREAWKDLQAGRRPKPIPPLD